MQKPGSPPDKPGHTGNTIAGPWPAPLTADEAREFVTTLFEQHHSSLLHYIARFTPNPEDATEILQDTYLRIMQQESIDHLQENARAYLYKVATNLMRDRVRREKSRHSQSHESFDENSYFEGGSHDKESNTPLRNAECEETLMHIRKALMGVPRRCRQVFILHRFMEMSYPEIAETLGISTRTVERNMKQCMAACKARIRSLL